MPSQTFNLFYDRKTPRPPWAGPVTVYYEEFRIFFAHSDVHQDDDLRAKKRRLESEARDNPVAQYTGGLRGNRPAMVSGTVTVCSTSGRGAPPGAVGRNLKDRRDQRGHLLALSSGGPEDQLQIIPQPDLINMKAGTAGAATPANQLGWRDLEVYAQYLCQRGRQQGEPLPPHNPDVQVDDYPTGLYVNGERLLFPPAEDYGDREELKAAPRSYRVDWQVVVIYSVKHDIGGTPVDNYPLGFVVRINCVAGNGATSLVCENWLRNAPSMREEYAALDNLRRKRLREKRERDEAEQTRLDRVAFNQAHPRKGMMHGKYPQ